MSDLDPHERLTLIKAEGSRRRAVRHRRNAAIAGITAACALAIPVLVLDDDSGEAPPLAATERCRRSTDPACGPPRWSTEPGRDEPLTARITEPAEPIVIAAGSPVHLVVSWEDPDAPTLGGVDVCWGDAGACPPPAAPCEEPDAHGTWTPPQPARGADDVRLAPHTYERPGTYDVTVTLRSEAWHDEACVPAALGDPYASTAQVTTSVRVE